MRRREFRTGPAALFSYIVVALSAANASSLQDAVFYSASTLVDLTADGRADSLSLLATGRHPDSILVTFTIHVDGRMVLRQQWKSRGYFRYGPPPPDRDWTYESKLREIRSELSQFFSAQQFARFAQQKDLSALSDSELWSEIDQYLNGGPNDLLMLAGLGVDAADSLARLLRPRPTSREDVGAIVRHMRDANPMTFTYYRGNEWTSVIAWNDRTKAFLSVYSCC
jgi:hypothetical protein